MTDPAITTALAALPDPIRRRSGSVFYTGRCAFEGRRPLYVLGLNPGGDPAAQADETVARDLTDWEALPARWSAYADERWQGRPAGTHGMQPRMLHLFARLGLDPRETPASNVVFVRSRGETELASEKAVLLADCWPVHAAVIRALGVRTILCLGGSAGRWTREMLRADTRVDAFRESNARGWTSEAHLARDGRAVITVTHPGRADWRNPAADPSAMVARVLAR